MRKGRPRAGYILVAGMRVVWGRKGEAGRRNLCQGLC